MEVVDHLGSYFKSVDLDIRGTRTARYKTKITPRFMDQKCTPDVLASCAGWVLNLPETVQNDGFFTETIWDSPAFSYDVKVEFSKPDAAEVTAQSEFDKFIAQPLKTLVFAGLLSNRKVGRKIEYSVINREYIEFISHGPRKARIFLCAYLKCVLEQSGIYHCFEQYFDSDHEESDYLALRNSFIKFLLNQTFIKTEVEIRRIFPKVLNPLAHQLGIPGAEKGHVSKGPILTSALLYNKENFRDKGRKQKGLTRQQSLIYHQNATQASNESMKTMMAQIRQRHAYQSELKDDWSSGYAAQVHHIFPKSQHPEMKNIPENLILLTPTQHTSKAHPRNHTSAIDHDYQIECLLAKTASVEHSELKQKDGFYKLSRLIAVINVGYSDIRLDADSSFDEVRLMLRSYQNGLGTKAVGGSSHKAAHNVYRVPESGGKGSSDRDLEN